MTMPVERTRSLRWAWEFMKELQVSDNIDAAQRGKLDEVLLTYPSSSEIEAWALQESRSKKMFGPWLEPEPKGFSRNNDIPTSINRGPLTLKQRLQGIRLAFVLLRTDLRGSGNLTDKQKLDLKYVMRHFPQPWELIAS